MKRLLKLLLICFLIFNTSFLFAQTDIEAMLGVDAPKNVLRQNELRFQAGLVIKDKLPEDTPALLNISSFLGPYSSYKVFVNALGSTDLGFIEFDTNNNPVYISGNNVTPISAPNGVEFSGIKGIDNFVSKSKGRF